MSDKLSWYLEGQPSCLIFVKPWWDVNGNLGAKGVAQTILSIVVAKVVVTVQDSSGENLGKICLNLIEPTQKYSNYHWSDNTTRN